MSRKKKKNIMTLEKNSKKKWISQITKKTIKTFLVLLALSSCSSILLAKKLEPLPLKNRIYRFCHPSEVKEFLGKICYRFTCEKSIFKDKECLIVEDLNDPDTHRKLRQSGLNIADLSKFLSI